MESSLLVNEASCESQEALFYENGGKSPVSQESRGLSNREKSALILPTFGNPDEALVNTQAVVVDGRQVSRHGSCVRQSETFPSGKAPASLRCEDESCEVAAGMQDGVGKSYAECRSTVERDFWTALPYPDNSDVTFSLAGRDDSKVIFSPAGRDNSEVTFSLEVLEDRQILTIVTESQTLQYNMMLVDLNEDATVGPGEHFIDKHERLQLYLVTHKEGFVEFFRTEFTEIRWDCQIEDTVDRIFLELLQQTRDSLFRL